jgi:signal transduction histidine kinase
LTKTLTYLNNTQEQLVQSEKMASLGRLVAGVAHEINTPLSIAITANSLVLDDTLEIKDKIEGASLSKKRMDQHITISEQSLVMSEGALQRVKHLLTNFKMVAADQIISEQRTINLAEYINDVMSTLSIEMKKKNINYQFIGSDNLEVITLPGVFSQVLTNLVINSIVHGFDERQEGSITIDITASANQGVEIHYKDDGRGMDAYTLANIFEPFFTTKRGKGSTGLGMNIVYNIVNQQLKGTITVASEQGVGTITTLVLPNTV